MDNWFGGMFTYDWLEKTVPPLILAMAGGMADYIMSDKHSLAQLFSLLFLAGFTGYMLILLGEEMGLSKGMLGVTCGIGGFSSKLVLTVFRKVLLVRVKAWFKIDGGGL